ncbi:MAG TPA: hydroxymethylglutaryl-CoA lyase [Acidimicrobiales bacterium]|nr:hydroxymethylglutaryl-CoA lyase [Acidimicrobiales bacterium]
MSGAPAPRAGASLPERIEIREVGPRDGLQSEQPVPVEDRVRLIEALLVAGATDIELTAFVSPRAVPSMADAGAVVAAVGTRPSVRRWALVPNRRGAELAAAAGIDALTMTVSASEAYSEKNVHMSVAESVAEAGRVCQVASDAGLIVDVVISCAFGSPYEGDLAPSMVASVGEAVRSGGAGRVTFADTTGMATPRRIAELLDATGTDVGLHLHETRGTALVNAYAAMQLGLTRFDTSVGGLGGSPFAAGAAGNLATEDLVHLCDDLGVATGLSLDALLDAAALAAAIVGHSVPSRVAAAGPRSRLAASGT